VVAASSDELSTLRYRQIDRSAFLSRSEHMGPVCFLGCVLAFFISDRGEAFASHRNEPVWRIFGASRDRTECDHYLAHRGSTFSRHGRNNRPNVA
jgi:hypothetical protein